MNAVAVGPLVVHELRLHRRHGLLAALAATTGLWAAILVALPPAVAAGAVRWILFFDLTAIGFVFVPALSVVERGEGVTRALKLTGLSPLRHLGVRVATIAALSTGAAAVVIAAGGAAHPAVALAGAALAGTLFSLLAVVLVGSEETLTGFIRRVPAVAAPLLAPTLVYGAGVWDSPLLFLSPATAGFHLIAGHWSWSAVAWLAAWIAALAVVAGRVHFDVEPAPVAPMRRSRAHPRPRGTVTSFLGVDRSNLAGDRVMMLVLAGIPLVALAVRWLAGPGIRWIMARYGLDLTSYLPVVWAFLLVVHTPVMTGSVVGLLFLEDRDVGVLPAVKLTGASLGALLRYRLVGSAFLTAAGVVVGLLIAGAVHPAGAVGMALSTVAAAAVAPVSAMAMAALAGDRVQGMAVMKILTLPLYLPIGWWFVSSGWGWLFALSPSAWAVRAFWSHTVGGAVGFAVGGVAVSGWILFLLIRRFERMSVD